MNVKLTDLFAPIPPLGAVGLWGSGIAFPDRIALGKGTCDRHNAILPESLGRQLFQKEPLKKHLKFHPFFKSPKVVLKCAGCLFCEPKTT